MIVPVSCKTFKKALQMASEVFHHLKEVLKSRGLVTAVGDEGGYAPKLNSNEDALNVVLEAIQKQDIFLAKIFIWL